MDAADAGASPLRRRRPLRALYCALFGAIYLAVLALLAAQSTRLEGFTYLVLYNLAFILPLVVILLAAANRPLLNRLGLWHLHHRSSLKLALGGLTILLGLGILLVA